MARKNQGGSVLSFILIGAALVLLFVTGAFIIKQATLPPTAEPTPTTQAPAAPGKTDQTPKPETTPAPAPAASDNTADTKAPSNTPSVVELPQTGLAEQFTAILALALLTATTISYIQSRRLHLSL